MLDSEPTGRGVDALPAARPRRDALQSGRPEQRPDRGRRVLAAPDRPTITSIIHRASPVRGPRSRRSVAARCPEMIENPSSTRRPPHGPWNRAASIDSAMPSAIVTVRRGQEDRRLELDHADAVNRHVGQVGAGVRPFEHPAHRVCGDAPLGPDGETLDPRALAWPRDIDRVLDGRVGREQERPRQSPRGIPRTAAPA